MLAHFDVMQHARTIRSMSCHYDYTSFGYTSWLHVVNVAIVLPECLAVLHSGSCSVGACCSVGSFALLVFLLLLNIWKVFCAVPDLPVL